MKVLVSVINWNNNAATSRCLQSIAELPMRKQPDVVLIDNASTQQPLNIDTKLQQHLRSLRIVMNKRNTGYAGGHNPSLAFAQEQQYDYAVLLNNDTVLIDSKLLDKLLESLEHDSEALAAAPTILSKLDPPIIWYGGGKLSTTTSSVHHLQVGRRYEVSAATDSQSVSFLNGCCLAIKMRMFKEFQTPFYEDYFLYWEDADWCAQALKRGYKLLYVPGTTLLHEVSSSLGMRSPAYIYYNIRNHILFIKRQVPRYYMPLACFRLLYITAKYIGIAFVWYRQQPAPYWRMLWLGWRDGWRGRGGMLRRSV